MPNGLGRGDIGLSLTAKSPAGRPANSLAVCFQASSSFIQIVGPSSGILEDAACILAVASCILFHRFPVLGRGIARSQNSERKACGTS
jgi:hypothetical protein